MAATRVPVAVAPVVPVPAVPVLRVVRPLLEGPTALAFLGLGLAFAGAYLLGEASRRWIEAPAGALGRRLSARVGPNHDGR